MVLGHFAEIHFAKDILPKDILPKGYLAESIKRDKKFRIEKIVIKI